MKKIVDFFIDRSLVVNLITVMVIIVGLISILTLQKETFPRVEFDVILVTTAYPGSSSEDVEKLVTISLERELKSVDGIKEMNALSAEGTSIIYLQVEPDSIIREVLEDVKNAIDRVDDLPAEAKTPRVRSLSNKNRGVLKVPLTGLPYNQLRKYAKKLQARIELFPGVAFVDLDGHRLDEIVISVDPFKLRDFDITISEVASSIRNRHLNLSAGKLETIEGDLIIRTLAEFDSIEEIKKLVLRSNNSGQTIHVSDIATVTRKPVDSSLLIRSQGKEAIFLDIKIKEKADILITTNKIKESIKEFFETKEKDNLEYRFVDDASYYVTRRLNVLKSNGILGIVLVFFCLMFFLNFSTSVITSLGAPIAFMVAFILMDSIGVSINLISMFGLILVLGMLVDDSIIVAEHYYQLLEKGLKPREAASKAAMDTIRPVTATILTTVVAFGSLFYMGGIMGKFLWSVPAVVIICLAASWLECFFILPSHLNDFVKVKPEKTSSRWYQPFLDSYERSLRIALKIPKTVLVIFLIILVLSGLLAKSMRFELFPGDDVRIVYLQIKGKVGTPFDVTNSEVKKLELMLMDHLKKNEYEQIKAHIGESFGDHGRKTGSHYGAIIMYLTPPSDRERSTDKILSDVVKLSNELVKDFTITSKKVQGGPPKGKPVEIELMGDSISTLQKVSALVHQELKKEEGLTSSEIDFEEGKKQIIVDINDSEARRLGLTTKQIAFELRSALGSDSISEIRENDEDIEIKIKIDEKYQRQTDILTMLSVTNNQGSRIPIAKVAKILTRPGAFVIRRFNRKRIFAISGTLDNEKTSPLKIVENFTPKLEKILKDFPEITYNFGGENKDTKESMMRLMKSGIISMFCIFLILVVMFSSLGQPIVVMMAIPLGLIGVIVTFYVLGLSLGFMAMMGVVALVGVVVNDSIVLVSFINKKLDETGDLHFSVVEGCKSRFRPVMLTTFTTVAGLLPVAHAPGGDPFLKPMATSFAWGLLFATFVTLVFIPCNYYVYKKILFWFRKKFLSKSSLIKYKNSPTIGT